jgi:hypothetical protein
MAIEGGYDYAAHVETDLLFAQPVAVTIEKMHRNSVRIAAPMAAPYQFIETGLLFVNCDYAREIELVERYDWANVPRSPLPEERVAALTDPCLFALPLRGCRNDLDILNSHSLPRLFPNGMDWITHADPATLRAFLEVNGLS